MKSHVLRSANIDKLAGSLEEFLRPNNAEEKKAGKRTEVKHVIAISSHEGYGDHVCIVIYE